MKDNKPLLKRFTPFTIAAAYLVIGGLWIVFSDKLLADLVADHALYACLQTIKGWAFIILTAWILYRFAQHSSLRVERSEVFLRDTAQFFQALFQASPLAVIALNRDMNIISWNPAAEKMFGWSARDVLGKPIPFVPREKQEEFSSLRDRVLKGEKLENIEILRQRKDGTPIYVSLSTAPIRDAPGNIAGIMSVIANVTERKQMEEKLLKSENRLRSIIEAEPECVKLLSTDGAVLEMNPAGLKMIEADSFEQVGGKSVYSLIVPEYRPAFQTMMEKVFKGESGSLEFEFVGMKGSRRWVETRSVPLKDAKGDIVALLGITRDITEHKKLENQLRHAQKMEAVGTLTGGIAHDFNNILTAIIGYGNILKLKMAEEDPLRNYVDQILASIERAANLTQGLLAFSRKLVITLRPVNLNEIIKRVEKLLHRLIGEDIELRTILTDKDAAVTADSGQIEQVLMNLATNARDAMPDGGLLTITTEPVELSGDFIRAYGYGKEGRYVLITVSDTGSGMDEKTKEKIFEPFFTTKEVGKGTGLGLSVVYGIIKQHNGYINCHSEPGRGATFKIYLPFAEAKIEEQETKKFTMPEGGTETVLVAEDDAGVRMLSKSVLENFGYNVIEAEDGEDAVRKFLLNKDKIHLLLLDVIMPRKGGKEAYEEIKKIRNDVKYLFMSGYSEKVVQQKGIIEKDANFILKPISPKELLKKVREALDR